MSPKKNSSMQTAKKEAPDPEPVPSRIDAATGEVKKVNRISLAMSDDDESFDFSSMRPGTKAKFAQAVQRDLPNIYREGGIAPAEESAGPVAGGFTDENVKTALDLCTSLSAFGASFLVGRVIKNPYTGKPMSFDGDIMRSTFVLTEKQHEELDPRGKRLANKYLPKAILENSDLAMFFGMWFTYLGENTKIALKLQVERETAKAAAGAEAAARRVATQPQGENSAALRCPTGR